MPYRGIELNVSQQNLPEGSDILDRENTMFKEGGNGRDPAAQRRGLEREKFRQNGARIHGVIQEVGETLVEWGWGKGCPSPSWVFLLLQFTWYEQQAPRRPWLNLSRRQLQTCFKPFPLQSALPQA